MRPVCAGVRRRLSSQTRPPVVVQAKVGAERGRAFGQVASHHGGSGEAARECGHIRRHQPSRLGLGVHRGHGPAGHANEPARGQMRCRGGVERRVRQALDAEGVAGELAVALPLQTQRAEHGAEVRVIGQRRAHVVTPAQCLQVLPFVLARFGFDQHGHIAHARGHAEGLRRTRVHLVGQHQALRMVGGKDGHVGPGQR
jgi:hypothetical protein